jgi:hypothetical protein
MAAEASVCSSLDCSATVVAPAAEAGRTVAHVPVDNRVDTNDYNVR